MRDSEQWFNSVDFGLLSVAVTASGNISPEADAILKAMSDYLSPTTAFSADADIDFEIVSHSGQKFQLSSSGIILMSRSSNFYITKKGMVSDMAFIYDGSTLTIHGKGINYYAQLKVDGSTDFWLLAVNFGVGSFCEKEIFVKQAEASVGRPLTPVSVAGVGRRTTRRTIRRTTT